MDDFNTYEYGAEQKAEKKWMLIRLMAILGYVLFAAAYFVVLYVIRLIPLFAVTPIFLWILIHFTWRYTKPDYRYYIEKGTFTFYVCYGKKTKHKKTEFLISSAKAIAPSDTLKDAIKEFDPEHVYSAVPSLKSTDVYSAFYTDGSGKRCVIHFIATERCLRLLRVYNSATVVVKTAV